MKIEMKPIDDLKPFKKNPKKHPEHQLEMLKKSMGEFGWTNPILVAQDNMIIAGHARYEAAKQLGLGEVPTIFIDLPYEKAVAYVVADNRLAELAESDDSLLCELLKEVAELPDFDMEAVGFSEEEFNNILSSVPFEEYCGDGEDEDMETPAEFKEYGEDIETDFKCPKCSYEWSGVPK